MAVGNFQTGEILARDRCRDYESTHMQYTGFLFVVKMKTFTGFFFHIFLFFFFWLKT